MEKGKAFEGEALKVFFGLLTEYLYFTRSLFATYTYLFIYLTWKYCLNCYPETEAVTTYSRT